MKMLSKSRKIFMDKNNKKFFAWTEDVYGKVYNINIAGEAFISEEKMTEFKG